MGIELTAQSSFQAGNAELIVVEFVHASF